MTAQITHSSSHDGSFYDVTYILALILAQSAFPDLEIHISETNVKPGDPIYAGLDLAGQLEAQATFYASIVRACRAQPRCKSFETWGFTDRHSYLGTAGIPPPGAFFFDEAYEAKLAREAVARALS